MGFIKFICKTISAEQFLNRNHSEHSFTLAYSLISLVPASIISTALEHQKNNKSKSNAGTIRRKIKQNYLIFIQKERRSQIKDRPEFEYLDARTFQHNLPATIKYDVTKSRHDCSSQYNRQRTTESTAQAALQVLIVTAERWHDTSVPTFQEYDCSRSFCQLYCVLTFPWDWKLTTTFFESRSMYQVLLG